MFNIKAVAIGQTVSANLFDEVFERFQNLGVNLRDALKDIPEVQFDAALVTLNRFHSENYIQGHTGLLESGVRAFVATQKLFLEPDFIKLLRSGKSMLGNL